LKSGPDLSTLLAQIAVTQDEKGKWLERIKAELGFAARLIQAHPGQAGEWQPLIEGATRDLLAGMQGGEADIADLVAHAEQALAPVAEAAKQYAVYCCGHAHIDMNWMWSWPETVSVTYDTFSTMDKLMDEFEGFHFSQSQVSVYHAMHKYAPELFEKMKQRVASGRWEVTASQWVEGSKNLAAGEILCRHLLYTRRWLKQHMGMPYDEVKIDWEPDTFGHCWTLPGILARGGVSRYYHHRSSGPQFQQMASGQASQLYWWEGKDGSRILTFDDSPNGYNNEITPHMTHLLFALERHTGLKRMLWVYGVGDHGGGPTRRHLRAAQEMMQWPVWPRVKLTTTDEFFSDVERDIAQQGLELPVHHGELNFVFEGCYTSESRIKFANRTAENDLTDTEATALMADRICGTPYPTEALQECWQRAMFMQFHDILPGSGVKETVEHAMGLLQENLATTGMIRTRGLRAISERINTSALAPKALPGATDMGLGAGVGNDAWWSGMSSVGGGESGGDVLVVFNPAFFPRTELVRVKIWNRDLQRGNVIVRDARGNTVPGQVIETGNYWCHSFSVVAFPAAELPALGYRAYVVEPGTCEAPQSGAYLRELGRPIYRLGYVQAQSPSPVALGNEFIEVTVCPDSGGIVSCIDKQTGVEFVPEGTVLGALQREQEAPHGMTAWQLAPITDQVELLEGCTLDMLQEGPQVAAVRLSGKHNDSEYKLTITIANGVARIDFDLEVNWLERGAPDTGVPALRVSFPLAVEEGKANFEIPFGAIEREADGEEVPALNWADLTGTTADGQTAGITLVNNSKYGHRAYEDALRLTLLRSSYDPDPLPELGRHQIQFALVPHAGGYEPAGAIQAGYAFNHALMPVSTTAHAGDLDPEASGLQIQTPNIMVAGLKRAEDSSAVIIRLFEFEGKPTRAQVRLAEALATRGCEVVETDLLERALDDNSARIQGDVLSVDVPPFGIATVKITS